MFFRFATNVGVDRLVPELLDSFPVSDLALLDNASDIVCGVFANSFFSDVKVQIGVCEHILLAALCL